MNGNIVGEPIDQFVQKQIGIRQSNQFSGYGNNLRTPEQLQYLNNRNAWIKLASSVKINSSNRLSDIGIINPSKFNGTGLAKKAVLFNTLSSYANSKLNSERAGVGKEIIATTYNSTALIDGVLTNFSISNSSDLWNDTFAYGIGGSDFGLQPPPGIIGATVDSINRGSIRKANVTLKAHNKFQFDIIELLYLRLGFTMMLEWGWDRYLDNNGNFQPVGNTIIEESWFTTNGITQLQMLNNIQKKRSDYSGNYDGFFGKVSNFTWNFNPDGSYDISIDLITLGDVIESLKVNTFTKTVNTNNQLTNIIIKEGSSQYGTNISKVINNSTIGLFLFTQMSKLTDNFSVRVQSTDPNYYVYGSINSKEGKLDIRPQYYIRLGEFFSQLENLIIPKVKNGGGNATSQITFNGIGNIISYFPNQIPLDPRVCLFKPSLNSYGDMEGVTTLPALSLIPTPYITTVGGRTYGLLSNIYLNFEFIAGLLLSNGGPEQDLYLIKFLQGLCDGINGALGGVNKLEPIVKDDNVITIIDQTLSISGVENFINLEVYGYNPSTNNPTSNFVKDIKFVSKITPQFASMVSIGAVAGGANTAEVDGTAFSKWNEGLEDRFSQNILEPKGVEALQQERDEQEKQEEAQWVQEIAKDAREKFVNFPPANKAEEAGENILGAIEEVDLWFAELVGIENDVNPLTGLTARQAADAARSADNDLNDVRIVKDDYNNDINGKPMTFQQYLYERYLFAYREKYQGIVTEEELSGIIPKNYALYLVYAFGGNTGVKVRTKRYTKTNVVYGPLGASGLSSTEEESTVTEVVAEPRYQEFDDAFISQGKAAYKNYINNLNNETYLTKLTPSSEVGFIPLSFELTLDGISGIKIYNQLSINNEFLPSNYPKALKFVITKVNHQIANNSWDTSLSTISIPRTEPYRFVESPVILPGEGEVSGDEGGENAGGGYGGGNLNTDYPTVSITSKISLVKDNGPTLNPNVYPANLIYVPQETKKTMVVLHHTAGSQRTGKDLIEATLRKTWQNKVNYPLATHYLIQNGFTEYVFDTKYWSNHCSSNYKAQSSSISVELGGYGWCEKRADGFWYNSYNGRMSYSEIAGVVDKYGKLTSYRGRTYMHKHTKWQIDELEKLINEWKVKHPDIVYEFDYDQMFPPSVYNDKTKQWEKKTSANAISAKPGFYSHSSFTTGKNDVMPQKELIDMLKRVLKDVTEY